MGLHSSHPLTELIADFVMSSTSTAVNTFNKSKEDFIWFVKKAVQDKKSYSYSELYHSLLKIFVDADTNRDGLVSKASFSKLIDAAASMPRAYGYASADSDLYKTGEDKEAARQKMFVTMDLHPIIDQGSVEEYKKFVETAINKSDSSEAVELYWYMVEMFTEYDQQKEGFIKMENFASMMHEFLATPVKHGLKTPSKDEYETIFKKYDPRSDGRLTVDEWMSLAKEEVYKKFL